MKATIALILVVLLVGVGATYYYFFAFNEVEATKSALKGDGSIACTLEEDTHMDRLFVEDGEDGSVRTKFMSSHPATIKSIEPDKEIAWQILIKDNSTYMWTDSQDFGLKDSREIGRAFTNVEEWENALKENNYSCSRTVNKDNFKAPNDVEFLNQIEYLERYSKARRSADNH